MKRVNAAFHARDIDALRAVGAEHEIDDSAFDAKSIGEKLVWAIREVSRLDQLIASLLAETAALGSSDLAVLRQRQQAGEDVIQRIEAKLQRQIDVARERLQVLIGEFRTFVAGVHGGR